MLPISAGKILKKKRPDKRHFRHGVQALAVGFYAGGYGFLQQAQRVLAWNITYHLQIKRRAREDVQFYCEPACHPRSTRKYR